MQRQVNKVLASRVRMDTPEMVAALEGLSEMCPPGENTPAKRRNLKSELERRNAAMHAQLVNAFHSVQTELEGAEAAVNDLTVTCLSITDRLRAAREQTSELVERTAALQQRRSTVESHHALVVAFLEKFQPSEEDQAALDAPEVTPRLFAALHRIGGMRTNCKTLLETSHQRMGVDILDSLALRLEAGYEKLYRWVQREARELQAVPDVKTTLVTALRLLRQMPVYHEHCCQEIAQSRRLMLIRRFIQALTRGDPESHNSRPIELQAHDPLRYVSDMFAWVHQAFASERDFFITIFAPPRRERDEGDSRGGSASSEGGAEEKGFAEMDEEEFGDSVVLPPQHVSAETQSEAAQQLGEVFEGVARPLKLRVEQALGAPVDIPTSFRVANMVEFYAETIAPLVSAQTTFHATLQALAASARARFLRLLHEASETLRQSPPAYTHDLAPPKVVNETIHQLEQLLSDYKASMTATTSAQGFAPVLAAIVDPLLEAVSASASDLDPSDTAVYQINVLNAIRGVLQKHGALAQARVETLGLTVSTFVEQLTQAQTSIILDTSGLQACLDASRAASAGTPLSELPGLSQAEVAQCSRRFVSAIQELGSFSMQPAGRVLDSETRRLCREAFARSLSDSYAGLCAFVSAPENNYGPHVLGHSVQDINTLLGVAPSF